MLRTDFTKVGAIPLWVMSLIFSISFFGNDLFAGSINEPAGALACNDEVNVSLDVQCGATITLEMILEGEDSNPLDAGHTLCLEIEGYPIVVGATSVDVTGKAEDLQAMVTEKDENGDFVNSCWGFINLEDKIPPSILTTHTEVFDNNETGLDLNNPCPVGTPCNLEYLTCADYYDYLSDLNANFIKPLAMDICTDAVNYLTPSKINWIENDASDVCTDGIVVHLSFTFVDDCDNEVTSEIQEYVIPAMDPNGGLLSPPLSTVPYGDGGNKLFLSCGHDVSPQSVYDYIYNAAYKNELAGIDAPTAAQQAAAAAAAEVIALAHTYPSYNGIPLNNDFCNTVTAYTDVFVPICGDECSEFGKYIRTWKVYDWCPTASGQPNYTEFIQVIFNADQEGPHVDGYDVFTTVDPWACYANVVFPAPHLHDECSDEISWYVEGPAGITITNDADLGWVAVNVPKGEFDFVYNGVDCCGNVTKDTIQVYVEDVTPPVAIAKQDIVISLTSGPGGTGIGKLFTENIDNGSFDGCSDVHLEVRRENDFCSNPSNTTYNDDGHPNDNNLDSDDGQFVKFCCEDLSENGVDEDGDGVFDYALVKVWLRVWDDGDMDGVYGTDGDNYNETWGLVRLEDKLTPIINCPPNITIGCEEDCDDTNLVGEAIAFSTCGPLNVTYKDVKRELNGCGSGSVDRLWSIESRPDISCLQTITKTADDITHPTEVFFPDDLTIDCTNSDETGTPYWNAGPCANLAYNLTSDTFYFDAGACYKVLNRWTVIDWCVYDPDETNPALIDGYYTDTQVIKIQDFGQPAFLSCDETIMVEANDFDDEDNDGVTCENNAVMLTQTAFDEGNCPSVSITWEVQIDLWSDWNVDYVFSSSINPSSPFYVAPTLPGGEIKITLPDGIPGSMDNHRVIWKASDGCGNVTSCSQNLMVVDKKAPTPYCVNISTALMENGQVALWACDFDQGSFDNCTAIEDMRFTFTSLSPEEDPHYNPATNCSARIFTCDDLENGNTVEVTVYAWDEKGNSDFCTVSLTLVDNNGSCDDDGSGGASRNIAGTIETEEGVKLENVEVTILNGQPEYPLNTFTDVTGGYAFTDNLMNTNYQIEGAMDYDDVNGVSTVDIVLIQRHILGISYLDSPYKMIAADANSDAKISAQDLVSIRQLILGVTESFTDAESWLFIDKYQTLDYSNPWNYDEALQIQDLGSNMMNEDFIAVKVGDVNSTAILNATTQTDNRSSESITLTVADKTVKAGQNVEVAFNFEDVNDFYGFQFTLAHQGLQLMNVSSNDFDIEASNFAMITKDVSTFSWNTLNAQDLSNAEVMMTFQAIQDVELSNVLSIQSNMTRAEAYAGDALDIYNVAIQFENRNNESGFVLYQNTPNPAKGSTNINFVLPAAGQASLTIYGVTGNIVKVISNDFNKGMNSISINASELPSAGVWFYTLENGDYSDTKRMILID